MGYLSLLVPLLKFSFRGVLWYQGESNAHTDVMRACYGEELETLIKGWRRDFGDEELYFVLFELREFLPQKTEFEEINKVIRSVCEKTERCITVADKISGKVDLHPPDKAKVAFGAADIFLKEVYGK